MLTLPRRQGIRLALVLAVLLTGTAAAQDTSLGFEGLRQDPSVPIEVTSENLTVDQARGAAVFSGSVVVVQGALRLLAATVTVEYDPGGTGIERMSASGGVTFATADDAAEAQEAIYDVTAGSLEMTGGVVLTQGPATITGDRLRADVKAGTGRMEGRVRTVFRPAGQTPADQTPAGQTGD